MAYLGNDLQVAFPVYRNIDDISGSFNSSTTSFPLRVSGVAPVPAPLYSQQCLISVGGVVQRPDDSGSEGFRLSGGNIIFASAPTTGADFFGVILAGADYINAGGNFPSGTAAVPSITFNDDLDTGIYNSGINQVSITTGGSERLRIDSAGQIESVSLGTAAAPAFSFTTDPNTGIYSPGADQVAISTNGTGRLFVDASGDTTTNGLVNISSIASSARCFLKRAEGSYSSPTAITTASTIGGAIAQGYDGALYRNTGSVIFVSDGAISNTSSPGYIALNTTPSGTTAAQERLRITSAGLVGIGASSVSEQLQLGQNGSGTDNYIGIWGNQSGSNGEFAGIKFFNNQANASSTPVKQVASIYAARDGDNFGGALYFQTANTSSGSQTLGTRMLLDSSGRLGIGTPSPGQVLDVVGNINTPDTNGTRIGFKVGDTFTASTTAAHYGLTFGAAGSNTVGLSGYNGVGFYTIGLERGRFDSSGRLLVGTSTALAAQGVTSYLQLHGTTAGQGGGAQSISYWQNNATSSALLLNKSRSATPGSYTIVQNGDGLGIIAFGGDDGSSIVRAASITAEVDGTPGTNDMPGRLVFSTTADGASSPTEQLRITSAGVLQVADAGNIAVGTTTGTKIGTATTQKLGFFNKTPVVQPAAVADATDAASVITQLNALLARMRDLGLIAT